MNIVMPINQTKIKNPHFIINFAINDTEDIFLCEFINAFNLVSFLMVVLGTWDDEDDNFGKFKTDDFEKGSIQSRLRLGEVGINLQQFDDHFLSDSIIQLDMR